LQNSLLYKTNISLQDGGWLAQNICQLFPFNLPVMADLFHVLKPSSQLLTITRVAWKIWTISPIDC